MHVLVERTTWTDPDVKTIHPRAQQTYEVLKNDMPVSSRYFSSQKIDSKDLDIAFTTRFHGEGGIELITHITTHFLNV
jgi:hypothetical protein